MELERSNARRTNGGYSSISKSLVDIVLPELLLFFVLLLSRFVVSSLSNDVAGIGVN